MIRLATERDLDQAEEIYNEILDHEAETVSYTQWAKGLYPTRDVAKKALEEGTFYVGEDEKGRLYGSVNLNHIQPKEYAEIPWRFPAEGAEVLVIHTLAIRPSCAGRGYGREFVAFTEKLAKELGCKTVRLDTYEGNHPAESLYTKLGYQLMGRTLFHFQQVIWETLICMDKEV